MSVSVSVCVYLSTSPVSVSLTLSLCVFLCLSSALLVYWLLLYAWCIFSYRKELQHVDTKAGHYMSPKRCTTLESQLKYVEFSLKWIYFKSYVIKDGALIMNILG